jgi:alpha-mannosidase
MLSFVSRGELPMLLQMAWSYSVRRMLRVASVAATASLLLAFAAAPSRAQKRGDADPPVAALSAQTQQTIQKLDTLSSLPAEEWRVHVGDMAHGEAPDLDDSSWPLVKKESGDYNDAVWYRRSIEVPKNLNGYDLTGSRVWFQFNANANGPIPEIIYFNGRRVALGEDLEPIVLFDHAQPGDRVLVAVKLLHTVDKKRFVGAALHIDFDPTRPNPGVILDEILATAELIPSLGADGTPTRAMLNQAAESIDLSALAQANQTAFDQSLAKAQAGLETLKPKLQGTTVRLTGNAHIDAAWLWPWTETVDVVRRTFGTALQLMNEYPQYTYTQSAAAYSEWVCEKYPSMCQEIQQRVKEGRWEMVGGMWVEPDLNMPDGESLVRQLLIGKRYFKQEFGADVRIGWNPDSFGYNWQLPQIYKKSGIDYFVTQKMAWNDMNQLPFKLFWWQSPDGSRVLTYFPHDYVNEIEPVRIAKDITIAREHNPGLPEMMHLYGIGDHGGGPTRAMLDSGLVWTDPKVVYPKMYFGVAQGFFSDVEGKLDTGHSPVWNYKSIASANTNLPAPAEGKVSLPVWNDELYFEYHRGVFTTQAEHKRNMRGAEVALLNAEKYSSLAWLNGADYPTEPLNEAWKKVLFNQFHDLAAGSGIGVIYKDAERDYDVVQWTAGDATSSAIESLTGLVNTKTAAGSVPVVVYNPLAWQRADIATVDVVLPGASTGKVAVTDAHAAVPAQVLSYDAPKGKYTLLIELKDVPSLGYEVLQVAPSTKPEPATDLKASGLTLENSALKVVVDPKSGCITSLYDKKAQFESIASGGCGNELIAFKDTPKDYDAWNIDADFDKVSTKLDDAESVKLIEQGPVRATIRVTRTWQSSKFVQDITLYANLDRVDIANDVDWHETHILLKAAFPLAASGPEATYEIPYGWIERPTTRNNSWEAAKFEVPALRWADLGDGKHGFSLINNSKYGYDAKDNVLRLSLLRSPTWPDAAADRGRHKFSYSLYAHGGDWKQALTVRRGYEFNYPLSAMQAWTHDGKWPASHSFVSVDADNVVLTALKKTEDGDALLLRFYEWAGKNGSVTVTVPSGATAATATNLMEKAEGGALPATDNKVTFAVHPFSIETIRVDYPAPAKK